KDDRFRILADMGSFRAFWVSDPTLSNYEEISHFSGDLAYGRYLFNSLVILVATVVGRGTSGWLVIAVQKDKMNGAIRN
ncbi:hypothetical protein ACC758_39545, partial [Rhizobium ruizarguesonis]